MANFRNELDIVWTLASVIARQIDAHIAVAVDAHRQVRAALQRLRSQTHFAPTLEVPDATQGTGSAP